MLSVCTLLWQGQPACPLNSLLPTYKLLPIQKDMRHRRILQSRSSVFVVTDPLLTMQDVYEGK